MQRQIAKVQPHLGAGASVTVIISSVNVKADIVIIGAGPAGIATAIAATAKGLRAVVADARTPPIDKACGEGLLPEGVSALRALGIPLHRGIAFPFSGIRFLGEDLSACAEFPDAPGFGIRRIQLHQLLVGRAEKAGVTFLWGAPLTDVESRAVTVGKLHVPCRWLVGADGQNSAVRKWTNLDRQRIHSRRFGFRRHFRVRPWAEVVEVYWGKGCQAVVTPVGAQEVGVAVLSSNPRLRLEQALPLFPSLAEKLRNGTPTSTERGDKTCLAQLPAVTQNNVALVGDASGTVDAITGYGLSLSFQQALCLAEALERENLAFYQSAHRKIATPPETMARLMLAIAGNAWIRRRALGLLGRSSGVFSRILSIHTRTCPLPRFEPGEAPDFGWKTSKTGMGLKDEAQSHLDPAR
jgi:flavin-dependent dehydrogenase